MFYLQKMQALPASRAWKWKPEENARNKENKTVAQFRAESTKKASFQRSLLAFWTHTHLQLALTK